MSHTRAEKTRLEDCKFDGRGERKLHDFSNCRDHVVFRGAEEEKPSAKNVNRSLARLLFLNLLKI